MSQIDSIKVNCVTQGDLSNLKSLHPLVFKIIGRSEHQPPAFDKLDSCPDITDDFPVYFYMVENENVIASCRCLPDILYLEGKKYRWAWGGAFLVDSSYRGKGLGKKLIRESTKVLHRMDVGRGSVFSTPVALHILRKLGFTLPGYADRFVLFKKVYPFLMPRVKLKTIAHICNVVYLTLFILFRPLLSWMANIKNYKITELDFQRDTQKVIPTILHYLPYHFNNENDKIRYKISTIKNTRLFFVLDHKEKLMAYLTIRIRSSEETIGVFKRYAPYRLMTLLDFGVYCYSEKSYELIVNTAINLFLQSDAEILEIISSSPKLNYYARRRGLLKIGVGMSFSFSVPNHWRIGEQAKDIANWPLTHFCGDAYTFG